MKMIEMIGCEFGHHGRNDGRFSPAHAPSACRRPRCSPQARFLSSARAVNVTDTTIHPYPLHNFMYQWAEIKAAWTVHLANLTWGHINKQSLSHTHKGTNILTLSLLPILNSPGPASTLNLFICQSVRVYASSLSRRCTRTHKHTR